MSFRHIMMACVLFVTTLSMVWAAYYAIINPPSMDVAGVIAAVDAPILALMGYAITLFKDSDAC